MHDALKRLQELLEGGEYSLRHIVDPDGQMLILMHLEEGWRVRVVIGIDDIIPSSQGDPPIALYNKLLHAVDVRLRELALQKRGSKWPSK